MNTFLELATVLQLILCLVVIVGIALALAATRFSPLFRWPLCALGAGSTIYAAGLFEKCWPVVRIGQVFESIGIAGMVLGLAYLAIKNPKFHHGR